MASPIGTKVTLYDGKVGTILNYHFGSADNKYGITAAGQPVFDIQLEDMSVLKNVPLSVLSSK